MKVVFSLRLFAVLLCLGALVIPVSLTAQQKWEFGADAALDINIFARASEFTGKFRPRPGFSVHGVSNIPVTARLNIQVGLGYAFKQYRIQWDPLILPSDIDPSLGVISHSSFQTTGSYHELQLPVLLKLHFQPNHRGIYAAVGPMLGLEVGYREQSILRRGDGGVEEFRIAWSGTAFTTSMQGCLGHRFGLTQRTDLGVEVYGNAYVNMHSFAPTRMYTMGARAVVWL